jgi:drug/metabolite transporter superfamily protein YnfA
MILSASLLSMCGCFSVCAKLRPGECFSFSQIAVFLQLFPFVATRVMHMWASACEGKWLSIGVMDITKQAFY